MTSWDPKAELRRYLQAGRDAMLWKLDGLSEYDVRRPMTPTATNLLGLVKHLAGVEFGYFGATFGRPVEDPPAWLVDDADSMANTDEADLMADMWAAPDESRDDIVGLYRRAWAHSDATIESLPLDATGRVPWWPEERRQVTLHHVLVRVIAETHRHAGHADIVREAIDGAAGMQQGNDSLPSDDPAWWTAHHTRVQRAAETFR